MLLCVATGFLLLAPRPQFLLTNARIIDGTGKPEYRGEILISGKQIKAVGPKVRLANKKGLQRIDMHGEVVAPGFIDSHSHAANLEDDPTAKSQLFQGITTAVIGQDGYLSGPFAPAMQALVKQNPPLNFAAFSGHNNIRNQVMGENFQRESTPAELEKMKALVEQDMKDGALGLSSGLEYNPGFYSNTREVIELAKIASKYHGSYISHIRSEDRTVMQAIDEVIQIAKEAKLPAQISHIKLGLPMVWGRSTEVIAKLNAARKQGQMVSADIYPYTYWQSSISVISNSRDWENLETWRKAIEETGGADKILLSRYSVTPSYEGKTILQIAQETGKSPEQVVLEIVRATRAPGSTATESAIVTAMDERDIANFLRWPFTSICSDGGINGSHPRGAGTFPRVLAYYCRAKNVLSLPKAIEKMTSLPARQLRFSTRGVLRVGNVADLVVFNPKTIQDTSTPKNPTQLATGISNVIVSGEWVIRSGKLTNSRPGKILRREK